MHLLPQFLCDYVLYFTRTIPRGMLMRPMLYFDFFFQNLFEIWHEEHHAQNML